MYLTAGLGVVKSVSIQVLSQTTEQQPKERNQIPDRPYETQEIKTCRTKLRSGCSTSQSDVCD